MAPIVSFPLSQERIAELLHAPDLLVHHLEDLGKTDQRLHAVVPVLLFELFVQSRVFEVRLNHLERVAGPAEGVVPRAGWRARPARIAPECSGSAVSRCFSARDVQARRHAVAPRNASRYVTTRGMLSADGWQDHRAHRHEQEPDTSADLT